MIQIFSNSLGKEELSAIEKVFESKWLGLGEESHNFEKEFSESLKAEHVLLFNCCTSAIYALIKAFGIGKNDEVIIPTVNFVAIPNAILEAGAKPVFADVDSHSLNLLPKEIERLKTKRTKAIFLLHYGGHPVPFDEIRQAAGNKILIFEDSANSVSSMYKGQRCGTLGDAGVFSFDAMKTLVMGDGGALAIKDGKKYELLKSIRHLGFAPTTISGLDALKKGKANRWWEYDLSCASGRFISNDILASIARLQLKKLPDFIQKRKQVWSRYQRELANIPGIELPPEPLPGTESSYYLYWIKAGKFRDQLANYFKEKGIYTTFRYFPLHLVPFYKNKSKLKTAEKINEETLNIPVHQNLSDDDVSLIVKSTKEFSKKYL